MSPDLRSQTLTRPVSPYKNQPDPWRERAACVATDPEVFFSPAGHERDEDREARVAAAKAICGRCPVVEACLADAYRTFDKDAIRGGLDPHEREQLARRERRRAAAALRPPRVNENRQRVIELASLGLNGVQIAERMGLSVGQTYKHLKAAKEAGQVEVVEPRLTPTRDPRCGTTAGRGAHRTRGEQTCDDCRDAYAAYMRERRSKEAA